MTEPTLMTAEAATTTEGQAASEQTTTPATVADPASQAQQTQQTTEGQTTDAAKTDEAGKTEGDQEKPQGAPEKYEFKAPDGREFDAKVLEQYSQVAKELNMSNESAQKMLDTIAPALAQKQQDAIAAARAEWETSSKADKEFGGDKLSENLAVAKKAMETFGTPELRTLLNDSGLGNHPEIIRAFYRAGKAISEDGFVAGGTNPKAETSIAQQMYPNMNP